MKVLLASLVSMVAVSSVALADAGFVRKSESDVAVVYAKDLEKITISKESFISRPHAMNFCADQDLQLGSMNTVLRLAIADIAQQDEFLAGAVVFTLRGNKKVVSGIGGWYNVPGSNDIFLMSSDDAPNIVQTELMPLNDGLAKRHRPTLAFRAICVSTNK
jgi:hypothetical protein